MVDNIGEACKTAGIPVEVIGGHGFYKAKEIIDIYKFLNYIVYQREEYKSELYLTDAYISFMSYGHSNFEKFLINLCNNAKGNSVDMTLDYLIQNTKLEQYYTRNNRYQAIANISKLRAMSYDNTSANYMPAFSFLEFMSSRVMGGVDEDESPINEENRKNGVVTVSTIHKSTGLSYPIVIIAHMDEPLINSNKIPDAIMKCKDGKTAIGFSEKIIGRSDIQYKKLLDQYIINLLEEELRILYVACTRAKHMLIFSCNNEKVNPKAINWINWIKQALNIN